MAAEPVRYWIDDAETIVRVNEAFRVFASANDAPELADLGIIGQSLWRFVVDGTTRHLYARLVARARRGRSSQFVIRCDAPTRRRQLEMTVAHTAPLVCFETRVITDVVRPLAPILTRGVPRTESLLRVCSWCNRIEHEGTWLEIDAALAITQLFDLAALPQLTHGICPDCVHRIEASLG